MFCVKALITTVIASAFVSAGDRPSKLNLQLDSNGFPIDNTTLLRISENEMAFDPQQSMAERKGCTPKTSCSKAGGHCVKSRAACDGTIDAKGCRGGKKCKCCIPASTPVPTPTTDPSTTPATENCSMAGGISSIYDGVSYCLMTTHANWNTTREWCNDIGMAMAQPANPKGLAAHIWPLYSSDFWYWLGGKGDNSNQVWLNGTVISNTDPSWLSGSPRIQDNYCLSLQTGYNTPLATDTCDTYSGFRLCEVIIPTGCPDGFFMTAGSSQCFKLFLDAEISWSSARTKCQSEDLVLAKPNAAIAVRDYIMQRYGLNDEIWVDARGTGSTFQWQGENKYLSTSNPLMYTTSSSKYSNSYCLTLATQQTQWTNYPTKPYNPVTCTTSEYPLCELIRE